MYLISKIKTLFYMIATVEIIVIAINITFLLLNREKGIINNTGMSNHIFISLGLIFFFISIYFNISENYFSYSMYLFFKHCGIVLIIFIDMIFIYSGCELGIENMEDKKLNLISNDQGFDNSEDSESNYQNNTKNFSSGSLFNKATTKSMIMGVKSLNIVKDVEIKLNIQNSNSADGITTEKKTEKDLTFLSKKNKKKDPVRELNNNIKNVHSICTELFSVYLFFIFFCILIIIYNFFKGDKDLYIQDNSNIWKYSCSLEKFEQIFSIIELSFLLYLLMKIKTLINMKFIFKCSISISYSIIIWIFIGPSIDVIFFII